VIDIVIDGGDLSGGGILTYTNDIRFTVIKIS
jgi:hypothetical protein